MDHDAQVHICVRLFHSAHYILHSSSRAQALLHRWSGRSVQGCWSYLRPINLTVSNESPFDHITSETLTPFEVITSPPQQLQRVSEEERKSSSKMVSGSGLCVRRVVVDARHHMLGRLASVVAKELLNGQRLVVVRCDEICMSGGLVRQKMKYLRFLRKRMNTKPSHGPIHFRSPAKIFWRTVRGMIPHKTKRGAAALARLKAYEGVPPPYDRTKRMVVPDAIKVLRLQPGHKYCLVGHLSKEVGWNQYDIIKELEEKRKQRSQVAYERRKQLAKLRIKAQKSAEEKLGSQLEILAPLKY